MVCSIDGCDSRVLVLVATMIRVYAHWQPGSMGDAIPREIKDFKTMEEAKPTIKRWRKTACGVTVSEFEETVIAKYVWGKKQ